MSTEQNKQVVRRFHEYYNQGNLDEAAALLAPNFMGYVSGAPGPLARDDFKNTGAAYLAAFPKSESRTVNIIAEGDTVAAYGVFRGTQTGDFMGIPATGKQVQFTWTHFFRLSEGKIVELRVEQDTLGMMQQLGVIPVPGQ
jgi:steroid delta-isomerase-like uncharacterized protein